jgi:hypothetical protein
MADIGTVAAAEVAPVQVIEQFTAPAGEAITAGQAVHVDATTGKLVKAMGDAADSHAGNRGIAITGANQANIAITAVSKGIIDMGTALSLINYGQAMFLSNTSGVLGTAAGSVSVPVGHVVSNFAAGTAPDRLLYVNL